MSLNQGNKAIRDQDTIYAGGTIKVPVQSTGFDTGTRVKRQGATSTDKPDDIAKIGNQEFPKTPSPKVGSNDDMGGNNFGIKDKDWGGTLPSGPARSSKGKLPTRPDQLRPAEKDISPIPGAWMTDRFGSPRFGRTHQGIDLHADIGTPVLAPNNGKVLNTGYGPTKGNYLILGDIQGNRTHQFMHLDKTLVEPGDIVKQGQVIAKSGNTGFAEGTNKAYPPHLHWEKYINGEPVDPSLFVRLPAKL
jgi:murein DD-endopeptidase MepM/ murein hydrolase activator NlpD